MAKTVKSKKTNKKDSANFKIDFDNLKELVKKREIAQKLKDKSDLEEEVLDSEETDAVDFQDIPRGIAWSNAPSLGKIANAPQIPITGIRRTPIPEETQLGENDPVRYNTGKSQSTDSATYLQIGQIRAAPEVVDMREIGRNQQRQFNHQAFINSASETSQREFTSISPEKYRPAERIDIDQAGRKDPLKREELKYEFKESGA